MGAAASSFPIRAKAAYDCTRTVIRLWLCHTEQSRPGFLTDVCWRALFVTEQSLRVRPPVLF